VGTAMVAVTDGAFLETVNGAVLDKGVNLRIVDADGDKSDAADQIAATIHAYRLKTDEELETEAIALAKQPATEGAANPVSTNKAGLPEVDPWKLIDSVKITLTESKPQAIA